MYAYYSLMFGGCTKANYTVDGGNYCWTSLRIMTLMFCTIRFHMNVLRNQSLIFMPPYFINQW